MRHHHLLNKRSGSFPIGDVSTVVLISFQLDVSFCNLHMSGSAVLSFTARGLLAIRVGIA